MKIIKLNDKRYPIKVELATGERMIIPEQKYFKNKFLRKHGCSLMAEYIALQYMGVKRIGKKKLYPLHLLSWHKAHTKNAIKSKVTLKGVFAGLKKLGTGKATYTRVPTAEKIKAALDAGYLVIMERGKPIHTITMVQEDGVNYLLDHGKRKEINVDKIAKRATKNETYRGMIVVRP